MSANPKREDVFVALFSLLSTLVLPAPLPQLVVKSRKIIDWDNVPAANQPALFLKQGPQYVHQRTLPLPRWQLTATVWIYYRADGLALNAVDTDHIPATTINQVLDALEALLSPPLGTRQTLGNLVYHCWIDGTVFLDDGVEDNQAVLVVPISILVGAQTLS